MSGQPSGSGSGSAPRRLGSIHGSSNAAAAIGNLTTSNSAPGPPKLKMQFRPTIPVRRKKEESVPPEVPPAAGSSRGGYEGRGRGGSDRGGRGRGGHSRPPPTRPDSAEAMVASGPFSMGPNRDAGRSRSTVIRPAGPTGGGEATKSLGFSVSLPEDRKPTTEDGEVYSDQEDGVQIVDMSQLSTLDNWAPQSLPKEEVKKKMSKSKGKGKTKQEQKDVQVKPEPDDNATPSSLAHASSTTHAQTDDDLEALPTRKLRTLTQQLVESDSDEDEKNTVNMKNALNAEEDQALDLSESEDDEEHIGDIRGDFVGWDNRPVEKDKIYFFQFPKLFPKFTVPPPSTTIILDGPDENANGGGDMDVDPLLPTNSPATPGASAPPSEAPVAIKKMVSFNLPAGSTASPEADVLPKVEEDIKPNLLSKRVGPEGQIGTLLIMNSGKVKLKLGEDMLFDVTPGSQATFLQHAVHLDAKKGKRAVVLGEINRRFVVSPNVDSMLDALNANGGVVPKAQLVKKEEEGLVKIEY